MEECVGECMNVEKKRGRVDLCVLGDDEWGEGSLFWIGVDFREGVGVGLKEIVRELIGEFVGDEGV